MINMKPQIIAAQLTIFEADDIWSGAIRYSVGPSDTAPYLSCSATFKRSGYNWACTVATGIVEDILQLPAPREHPKVICIVGPLAPFNWQSTRLIGHLIFVRRSDNLVGESRTNSNRIIIQFRFWVPHAIESRRSSRYTHGHLSSLGKSRVDQSSS
ncbi:hypothetical protein IAQ61_001031 [Plenodomus lingam]|uniref:uncharacterized protein n=1 Tax=Leptosphaeria maculans TaxID=5022 RepID=UPI00332E2704|nr:hypothetical protein IAQ61_001031 [Plenodomus lingam]